MEDESQVKDNKLDVISGIILVLIAMIIWTVFYYNNSIFYLVLATFATAFSFSVLLGPFSKFFVIRVLLKFLGWIIGIYYLLVIFLLSCLLIFLSGMIIFASVTIISKCFFWLLETIDIYVSEDLTSKPILYLSILLTGISLSYYGEKVISLLDKILSIGSTNKNGISKNIAILILKYVDLRRRFYEFSILLYILTVCEDLSQMTFITADIWVDYKSVALEVLLTFVAIDGYVSNFLAKPKK